MLPYPAAGEVKRSRLQTVLLLQRLLVDDVVVAVGGSGIQREMELLTTLDGRYCVQQHPSFRRMNNPQRGLLDSE
jgi:hypothetical protein